MRRLLLPATAVRRSARASSSRSISSGGGTGSVYRNGFIALQIRAIVLYSSELSTHARAARVVLVTTGRESVHGSLLAILSLEERIASFKSRAGVRASVGMR